MWKLIFYRKLLSLKPTFCLIIFVIFNRDLQFMSPMNCIYSVNDAA